MVKRVKVLAKTFVHMGEQYPANSVVEVGDAEGTYLINSGAAIYTDEEVTTPPGSAIDALKK